MVDDDRSQIIVGGRGQGDVVQVINGEWFEIKVFFGASLEDAVVLKAMSPKFEFEPMAEGGVYGVLEFEAGDGRTGTFRARADVDCPSPTRIVIVNYQIAVDEMMMWQIPRPSFIQIAPSAVDVASGNDANLNDPVLCNLPDDVCSSGDVICGTPAQIAEEILCDEFPALNDCGGGPPSNRAAEDGSFFDGEQFKLLMVTAMWVSVGLMALTVVYRNLCGGDGAAMKALKNQMDDLNQSMKRPKLPKDAVDAEEFMKLAGFDPDDVFSRKNPNPIVLAQAQMSLQKMLSAIKAK